MTEKMTVLYVKATGHVLAALTRVAAPKGEITKEDLVGQGLPFSGSSSNFIPNVFKFNVPVNELEMSVVDLVADLLLGHSQYSVDEKHETAKVTNRSNSTISVTHPSSSQVTITIEPNVRNDTKAKIWVQIESEGMTVPIICTDEATVTPAATTNTTGPLTATLQITPTLQSGDYHFLILAAGYRPQATVEHIP
jgi:hypothetical protein